MERRHFFKGIAQKWLLNSFGVVLIVLTLVVAASSLMLRDYYYGAVRQMLLSRSDFLCSVMDRYATGNATGSFDTDMRSYIASFSDKDTVELMAVDADGGVLLTSSGFTYRSESMPDFEQAITSQDGIGWWTGEMNGQRVMAVCRISTVLSSSYAAFRFVVSLELVDRSIVFLMGMITLLALLILLAVFCIGLSFTGSLVRPIREIGAAARRIAGGDFGTRVSRSAKDELGELCETVNSMADALETNERLKNEFISSVSHELRTPLTAIKGWAETLQSAGADGAITAEEIQLFQKGMQVINDETQRLSGMVEELLDFSRMQSGRLRMEMQRMDLLAELEEAVLIYEEKARQEGISLRYSEPPMLPVITGDRNRLRQVFINVIDNAIKYSDAGGTVQIAASVRGDSILIQVTDEGIGIAPEDLPRVKTRFYKGNYSRRGNGIGLAVADEIVTQHGGSLSLTSTLGVGTSVQILLPIRVEVEQLKVEDIQKIISIE